MSQPHNVSSKYAVDTPVGKVFTLFRSSRGNKRHNVVKKDQLIRIVKNKKVLASGYALEDAKVHQFSNLPEKYIVESYVEKARTPDMLFQVLKKMYEKLAGYERDTPTVVIRVRRDS
ncbi:MAG TPA: hypothetical protein VHW09_27160 [Bryobacteraceae bacterium]|nr:hypothetical protein [Bryobacteraceae bacterium]